MNPISILSSVRKLSEGAIEGTSHLDGSEIAGVTIAGIGIVFCCLVLLVGVIWLFGTIFSSAEKKKKAQQTANAAKAAPKVEAKPVAKPAPAPVVAVSQADDDEVIAVISAVVAMMSVQDGKTYAVKSVRPQQSGGFGGRTAWAMDGRRQNVAAF